MSFQPREPRRIRLPQPGPQVQARSLPAEPARSDANFDQPADRSHPELGRPGTHLDASRLPRPRHDDPGQPPQKARRQRVEDRQVPDREPLLQRRTPPRQKQHPRKRAPLTNRGQGTSHREDGRNRPDLHQRTACLQHLRPRSFFPELQSPAERSLGSCRKSSSSPRPWPPRPTRR